MNNKTRRAPRPGCATLFASVVLAATLVAATASAQAQEQRTVELDTIEIESEVPERVAQFFVQRGNLQYKELEQQPSFMPRLLQSVEEEPF